MPDFSRFFLDPTTEPVFGSDDECDTVSECDSTSSDSAPERRASLQECLICQMPVAVLGWTCSVDSSHRSVIRDVLLPKDVSHA